ncbi:amidohydrolase family protein [Nocardioides agariphilus]|uniref:Amidohydrolase family protein n=1 Tax=Nocardioides agariphilus TaxID=433664 RepID=A0A930VMW4_9ACTN|nr:amidohydrolase family protein [Nocardioides agariphilus]
MDFLLRSARIVELTGGPGWAGPVDVLVEAGRVRDIDHDLPRPPGIPEIDAEGRWLIPGLWDMHTHLRMWTAASGRLDLAGTRSAAEALSRLRARLAAAPGEPVIGYGHRPATWPVQPSVALLDEVAPDVPVVLVSGDAHHGWLNSRALEALGLAPRDDVLVEAEWYVVYPRIAELAGDEASPDAYLRMEQDAAAKGVVGVLELEYGEAFGAWPERIAGGVDLLRVRRGVYADGLDAVIEAGLRTGDALAPGPDHVEDLLTMGPLKIISDGSLNTRTAWCEHPYAGGTGGSGSGAPNQTPAELRALMTRATEHGLRTAVHAIGDAACHDVVAAYAETGAQGSIEHAQLMTRRDVTEMARLGIVASVQPAHLLDDRDITELIWPDRADRCFPLRWMLDDGAQLAMGSDAPVSPLDPWLAIAAAVHRSADERPAWHPEQALSPREALAASIDGQGPVHAGAPADLALLDADPLDGSGSPEEQAARLRSMPVAATWVAGRLTNGDEDLAG